MYVCVYMKSTYVFNEIYSIASDTNKKARRRRKSKKSTEVNESMGVKLEDKREEDTNEK